ncbi:MAG: porphobilinogen synthase [Acidobacteria bacterium]|nr:porphobilinogen synthase [Acidobacteriota bacterium]MBV9477547.1 porphobilinogen synthase [Acidobacteriota bacterium]
MTTKTLSPTNEIAAKETLTRRPRRLRRSDGIRALVRETVVRAEDLIYPLFVVPNSRARAPIGSMPGVEQLRVREAVDEAKRAYDLGVRAVLLFGLPEFKDGIGSSSWDPSGPVQQATEAIKRSVPAMTVMADVCLCEYTDHGHCGVIVERNGVKDVDNDQTLPLLMKQAISFAAAGADFVAPSDMMDGRIGAIRRALDERGLSEVGIMAYSAKFASGFYGPFREAAESAPQFGDRRTYQMDPANAREALHEMQLDVEEGADIIMVKPALSYLDIIRQSRDQFPLPIAAYNVSGEYSMVKAAAERGWIDGPRVTQEILTSIKRAGADLIITYHAVEYARTLRE